MLGSRLIGNCIIIGVSILSISKIDAHINTNTSTHTITAYSSPRANLPQSEFKREAGRIDAFQDLETGTRITGWIANPVDELNFIGQDLHDKLLSRVELIRRPDVTEYFGNKNLIFWGFNITIDNFFKSDIACIVAANADKKQVIFSTPACSELLK